ncbi:hypothetical protein [Nostoc sp. KVJ3]|uniref:hypothetical protein n=1 Tax=Nostoc sp. KVJ3 TaxID=457945 RepID=UPI002238FAFC|nr:hypothetical protein [Nostoc sp. KVJ3]
MHVNGCNFRQAIAWLHERFGEAGAERAAISHALKMTAEIIQSEPRPQFQLRVEDKANWPGVEHYLTRNVAYPKILWNFYTALDWFMLMTNKTLCL